MSDNEIRVVADKHLCAIMRDIALILLVKRAGGTIELSMEELIETARDTAVATTIHNGVATLTTMALTKGASA